MQTGVAHQRARQQVGLAQDLEAVADAEHRPALGGVPLHRLHDRAEPRDGPRAQVVAVAEAAGQDHHVGALEAGLAVPDEERVGADALGGAQRVEVAVAAGKADDRHPEHQASSTSSR